MFVCLETLQLVEVQVHVWLATRAAGQSSLADARVGCNAIYQQQLRSGYIYRKSSHFVQAIQQQPLS